MLSYPTLYNFFSLQTACDKEFIYIANSIIEGKARVMIHFFEDDLRKTIKIIAQYRNLFRRLELQYHQKKE